MKITFLGRVIPDTFPLSLTVPDISVSNPKNGLKVTYGIRIEKSAVTVEGETNRYDPDDFGLLFTRALDVASAATDLVGFSLGVGLQLVLDWVIQPDGQKIPIMAQQHNLQKFCNSFTVPDAGGDSKSFDEVFRIVATTPELFLSLNDLISGLLWPHQGPIVLARSLETLRRLLSPNDLEPKKQWPYLHEILRVEPSYLVPITELSTGPRHGDRTAALKGSPEDMSQRMWILMDRCFEYFKRGKQKLPEVEFPILK